EFANGVLEPDAAVDHFFDQFLESLCNHYLLLVGPLPLVQISSRQPPEGVEIFLARLRNDVLRQRWHRRLSVPTNSIQVVPDELFVKARLRPTWRVLVFGPEA